MKITEKVLTWINGLRTPRRAASAARGRDGVPIEVGQRVQNADYKFESTPPRVIRIISENEVVLEWHDGVKSHSDAEHLVPIGRVRRTAGARRSVRSRRRRR